MAGNTFITQTNNLTKNSKKVETEIKNSVQNINVDLSKLDMSGALDSFKRLEAVSKAVDFGSFINKIMTLQEAFVGFQKAVQTANTSVTNFSKSSDKLQGGNTAIVTNVEINTADIGSQIGDASNVVSQNFAGMSANLSSSAAAIGGSFTAIGAGALDFGNGIAVAAQGIGGLIDSVSNLFVSIQGLGQGLVNAANGITLLIPLLPALGTSLLQMAINMSGILAYLPELLVFVGLLLIFSILGEGLMAAGSGLLNIGLGLTSMTEGMTALLEFMPIFIASLAGITDNVGGIILFVLLAAAMLVMAIALQTMNEQMTQFVTNMQMLHGIMSVGFVAAFVVFGAVLLAMSLFMGKVATGMNKVTQSMNNQSGKLAVLNPLLAAQAILTNPFVGVATVALAVAGGLLVKALLPAMATGGVVSSPTVAMVGEGKYPEAVVPLGDSPQFGSMKADIANAVVQAMKLGQPLQNTSGNKEQQNVTLNIDGQAFARLIMPQLKKEGYRRGYDIAIKGV